jgi:hypothetical protein
MVLHEIIVNPFSKSRQLGDPQASGSIVVSGQALPRMTGLLNVARSRRRRAGSDAGAITAPRPSMRRPVTSTREREYFGRAWPIDNWGTFITQIKTAPWLAARLAGEPSSQRPREKRHPREGPPLFCSASPRARRIILCCAATNTRPTAKGRQSRKS